MKGSIKYLISFILVIIAGVRILAADYYWVGGSGNWSDFANHWATTSGGGTFHTQVPISTDDVYFNNQSFTGNAQTVTIDVPAVCRNFDWTNAGQTFSGLVNGPTIAGSQNIEIFGNFILDSRMRSSGYTGIFRFLSAGAANIDPQGVKFTHYTYNEKFRFESNGTWTLLSTIDIIGGLKHDNGTINFGNTTQNLGALYSRTTANRTLNLQSSTINLVGPGREPYDTDVWMVENGASLSLNAGTSTIVLNFTNIEIAWVDETQNRAIFNGGGETYNNIISTANTYAIFFNSSTYNNVTLLGKADINDNNTFNGVLTLTKGYEYKFSGTNTQTFNPGASINAVGDCQAYVYILSDDLINVRPAIFSKASWTGSTLDFTILFNLNFTTAINATNSINNGQNTGITFTSPAGVDTYWRGGNGDWNDATKWSTGCVPTPVDNVFFDAASFTAPGQKVTISSKNAYCKDMTWTGATNSPELTHSGILDVSLNIYGSLTMIPNMSITMQKNTNFWGAGAGNTITSTGQTFKYPVNFNGIGTYTLQDAFEVRGIDGVIETGIISLHSGTLTTNNQEVKAKRFESRDNGRLRILNMGSSVFTLYNDNIENSLANKVWRVDHQNMTLNSGTSTINVNNLIANVPSNFRGGQGLVYYNVNFLNTENAPSIEENENVSFRNLTFAGNARISRNISVSNLLQFSPGKTYTITNGKKITLGNSATFDANGNCTDYINIQSDNASQTTIEKLGGASVSISYANIKNVAAGTVAFSATNSFDLGGNSGWSILGGASRDLYWVGGSGNWNNPANWSLTSGGVGGACPPTLVDNVFFDVNSFTAPGQTVTLNVNPASCRNMTWTGVTNNPSLASIDANALNVYGSLVMSNNMNVNNFLGGLNFVGVGSNSITTNGVVLRNNRIKFNSVTGTYTMQDNFTTTGDDFRGSVQLVSGTLNTNGRTMNWNGFDSHNGSFEDASVVVPYTLPRNLILGNSTINILGRSITEDWDVSDDNGTANGFTLNAGTSNIVFPTNDGNKVRLGNNTYYNVQTRSNTNAQTLRFYGNATFNSLKLNSNTRIFNNTTVNDTMYFAPGNTFTYQSGSTHNFSANSKIIVIGTNSNRILIQSSTPNSAANWVKPAGTVCTFEANIRDNNASGGASFSLGSAPNDQGGNTGWNFNPYEPAGSVTLSGSNNSCAGANVTLTFNLTPALPKSIVYTDGTTNFTINNINTNTHTVTVNPTVNTTYSIVSASANVCLLGPVVISGTAVITILPNTALTAQPSPVTICEGQNASFSVGATGHNLTYQWKQNTIDISNGGIYSGATSNTLSLTSATTSANYSVVVSGTCGAPQTSNSVSLTVKPLPILSNSLLKTICSGENSNVSLTSTPVGADYTWTSSAVAGLTGNGNGSGNTISQVLTQNGTTALNSVYVVTPTLDGCTGNSANVTLTVNPIPAISNSLVHSICSQSTTNISLTSGVFGTTFSWTTAAVANLTGNSDGSGASIAQTLTNSSSSTINATYTVTPTANTCLGTSRDVVVSVFPLPVINPVADQSLCSGTSTNINLSSAVAGASFSWATASVVGITGNTNGSGNSISQSLINSTNAGLTVVYQVTATANTCSGSPSNINVNILPNPLVNIVADQDLCSGATSNILLGSNVAGSSFTWTSAVVAGVSGNANGSGSNISQTLNNSTNNSITISYIVSATANTCTGISRTINVSVHPIPNVNPANESICSGNTSNLNLSSNVSGATFTWTTAAVTDLTGNSNGTGNIISQALTNSSITNKTALYSVTPTANGCTGTASDVSIIVIPRPTVNNVLLSNICSGTSTNISLSSDIAGATFTWTSAALAGISGNTAGSGTSIAQTLSNSTSSPINVSYEVTATSAGCPSSPPLSVVVSVVPLPQVTTPTNHNLCSNATTNIALTSNIAGANFAWTSAAVANVTGNINGTGNVIAQQLNNSSKNNQTVVYAVSATANSCTGNASNINVTIRPEALYTGTIEDSICSGSTSNIALSSDVSGATFTWTTVAVADLTGNSNGTGTNIAQTLSNSSNTLKTLNYQVIPSINSCPGTPATISVKVYPLTVAGNVSGGNTICEGSTSNLLTLSGNTGSVVRWESSSSPFSTWTSIVHTGQTYTSTALTTTTRFRAIVASGVCSSGISGNTEVAVIPGAVNTGSISPGNTICEGQNGNVLTISGYTGSMVRWEVSNSPFTSWTVIANTSDSYNPGVLNQTTQYRAVITNGVCAEANTAVATITVNQRPRISVQPSTPPALCEGTGIDLFEITATGTSLNYQWRENNNNLIDGGIYSGTTSDRLVITNPPLSIDGNTYQVFISNLCGSALSDPVVVQINANTSISAQPLSPTSTCVGSGAQFRVTATGANLSYQWRESGTNLSNNAIYSGVSTDVLQMSSTTQNMDNRFYDVVVTGTCGTQTSIQARLQVNPLTVITLAPADQSICEGLSADFNIIAQGANLSYVWKENDVILTNTGVYDGTSTATLSISSVNSTLDGRTYKVEVNGACGSVTDEAILTVNRGVSIQRAPSNVSICDGLAAVFDVQAQGTGLSYEWFENGNAISNGGIYSGATQAILNLSNATLALDSNQYSVKVKGLCSEATSSIALLLVNTNTLISSQPSDVKVCAGGVATFTINSNGVNPSYQWFEDGVALVEGSTYIGTQTQQLQVNSPSTNLNNKNYRVEVRGLCGTVNSTSALLTVEELVSLLSQPSNVAICQGNNASFSVNAVGTGLQYRWKENAIALTDNAVYSGSNTATLNLSNPGATLSGNQYELEISASCGNLSSSKAVLTINLPVSIITQPQDTTVCSGARAAFNSLATGTNLSYQWFRNGIALAPETANSLNLTNTNVLMNNQRYKVVATGICNSVESREVTLRVNQGTALLSDLNNRQVCAGESVVFSVNAEGSNISYEWREDGLVLPSVTGNSYSIASVPVSPSTRNYQVKVTGLCGEQNSRIAVLTVQRPTLIITQPRDTSVCAGNNLVVTFNVEGDGLRYQWRENGAYLIGETRPTLTLTNVGRANDQKLYDVEVYGQCGNTQSSQARLTVFNSSVGGTITGAQTVCEGTLNLDLVLNAQVGTVQRWERQLGTSTVWQTIDNTNVIYPTGVLTENSKYRAVVRSGVCPETTSSEAIINIDKQPSVPNAGDDRTVCDTMLNIQAQTAALGTGQWRIVSGDGGRLLSANSANSEFRGKAGTAYTLVWELRNGVCLPKVDTMQVQLRSVVRAEVSNDTTIKLGKEANLWARGGDNYIWSPSESLNNFVTSTPKAKPQVSTMYYVKVSDNFGCEVLDSVLVIVDNNFTIKIPNAFSPNGNNENETWIIENIEFYPQASMEIFNRWGQVVRKMQGGENINWDGKNNNGADLEVGTYFYVLKTDPKDEGKAGSITLVR